MAHFFILLFCSIAASSLLAADRDCNATIHRDKFEPGVTTYEGPEIVILGKKFETPYCYMKMYRVVKETPTNNDFAWMFYYVDEDWKFISGIRLLIDGKVESIDDSEPARQVGDYGLVFEAIECKISDRILKSVEKAASVSVRLVAKNGTSIDYDFSASDLECIREFRSDAHD